MPSGRIRGLVQTVLGPVPPSELGATTTHEHLYIDFSFMYRPAQDSPSQELADAPLRVPLPRSLTRSAITRCAAGGLCRESSETWRGLFGWDAGIAFCTRSSSRVDVVAAEYGLRYQAKTSTPSVAAARPSVRSNVASSALSRLANSRYMASYKDSPINPLAIV